MAHRLMWKGNKACFIFSGVLDWNALNAADSQLYGHPNFDKVYCSVYDLSGVESINLNEEDLLVTSTLDKGASRWNKKLRLAIITNNDEMRRYAEQYVDLMQDSSWTIMIFNTRKEAEEWCDEIIKDH